MIHTNRLFAATLILLAASGSLHGQWRLGPVAGYEFGQPVAIDRTPGVINVRPDIDGSGESYSHTFWLGSGLSRAGMFGAGWNLSARLALGIGSGRFTSFSYDDLPELDLFGSIIYPRRRLELSSTAGTVRLDAGALYSLGSGLQAGTGFWLDARFLTNNVLVVRTETPVGYPDSVIGLDGTAGASRFFSSSPLSFGPSFALAADIPIGAGSTLRPELFGRIDLPRAIDGNGGAFSGGFGIGMMFDLAATSPPPLSEVPPPAPVSPKNDIAVDLYAGDETRRAASVTVGLRSTLHRRYLPLLPLLSYGRDSVAIPSRYTRLTADEADRFSLNALVGLSPALLHGQMLNILGMRLRAEPKATITIIASGSSIAKPAVERGRRIAAYLAEVWKIEPSRVAVTAEPSNNDRSLIRITSNMPALFAPVVLQWIAGEISVPPIGLDPTFDEKRTRSWRIVVSQGARTLGEYGSATQSDLAEIELPLLLRGRRGDSTLLPLVATLSVEGIDGETTTARDELQLVWSSDSLAPGVTPGNAEIFSYLLLDPPDAMPELDITNRAMMLKIQESARTGARLTLSGFGVEKPIAERAAGEILAALERRKIHAVELHVITDAAATMALPEEVAGRSGVDVIMEQ